MVNSVRFIGIFAFIVISAQKVRLELSSSVRQEGGFKSANTGDKVTLQCFHEGDDSACLHWYTQTAGQKPRHISTFFVYDTKITFHGEFKNNPRFTLDTKNKAHHLTISDLQTSDSANYYCAISYTHVYTFSEGIAVTVREAGFNVQTLVEQSMSQTTQLGGSVTLNCTVHTGTCDGEHSVYWFKNEEKSHPGLIYTQGGRNDQCERKPNTQTQTCVYDLSMKGLNLSHTGTYYCAVASCGRIVFGNGTVLDFGAGEVDSPVLVYFLSGALMLTTILMVALIILVLKMNEPTSCTPTESRSSAPSTTDAEGNNQNTDNLCYAALDINPPNRSRIQRNNISECVYSSVRQ
uniref:Ig-like domain-containing protein n=1 Tax=Amphiprion percula TaxID=161767 RepID=A0A3P8TJY0_AMPPE